MQKTPPGAGYLLTRLLPIRSRIARGRAPWASSRLPGPGMGPLLMLWIGYRWGVSEGVTGNSARSLT